MDKNVLATAITNNEAKSLFRVVPFHGTDLLDGSLIGRLIRPLGPGTSRLFLQRRAGVDAKDFRYLHALLTRCRPDFERSARGHGAVAAALNHAHVQEGIAAARQLYEAEAFFRVVPLHRG